MSSLRYENQLELPLNKTRDATPQEVQEWREDDFFSKGDFDPLLLFVVIPTVIQLVMVGLMLGIFVLNEHVF
jgi:hypothetical protein